MNKTLILFIISMSVSLFSNAQLSRFKALYTYNICRYIEWPASYGGDNFTIGIIGSDSELKNNLNEVAGSKTIGSKKIIIKDIKSTSDINGCNVLYFVKGDESKIGAYKTGAEHALIITENTGATSLGAGINFYTDNNKLKFELKESNIKSKDLKISSELTTLAAKKL